MRLDPLASAIVAALGLGATACATGSSVTDDDGVDVESDAGSADAARDEGAGDDAPGYTSDAGSQLDSASHDASVADAGFDALGQPDSASPPDSSLPDTGTSGCAEHGFSGALAAFDLSSEPGSETSAPATSSAAGVTAGALSRAATLTAVTGSGSINSSGWSTGATADATRYYTFSITPASGCTVTLTSLALDVKASATGPAEGDVATSADGFAAHSTSFAGTSTPTVALSGATGTGAIEVRIYGYGATGTAGTFRIQDTATLSGSIE